MKKIIIILFAIAFTSFSYAQTKPTGLQVNDKAPEFTAKDQNGKIISLKDKLTNGPVVLIFYRGQWCPYCNKELTNLEDSLSLLTAKGAELIAITPEQPANVEETITKTKASYSIITDDNLKIMKDYDVAFAVDPETIEKYKSYGIDFSIANGNNGANLPIPAVYIIDKKGNIIYRYFNADYTKRPGVMEIVEHL
ncbi:MAG: peroxiredoxin-like family protein [Ginsengibacter sp.]